MSDQKPVNDDYDVGYGKPPMESRFPKGKSGNPRGRPRNTSDPKRDMSEAFDEALLETVSIRRNGKTIGFRRSNFCLSVC